MHPQILDPMYLLELSSLISKKYNLIIQNWV